MNLFSLATKERPLLVVRSGRQEEHWCTKEGITAERLGCSPNLLSFPKGILQASLGFVCSLPCIDCFIWTYFLWRPKKVAKKGRFWPLRSADQKKPLRCCPSGLFSCMALVFLSAGGMLLGCFLSCRLFSSFSFVKRFSGQKGGAIMGWAARLSFGLWHYTSRMLLLKRTRHLGLDCSVSIRLSCWGSGSPALW